MTVRERLDGFLAPAGTGVLGPHLARQRWYGGRDSGVPDVTVVEAIEVAADPALWVVLVEARPRGGEPDLYHLLLTRRPLDRAAAHEADDPRVVVVDATTAVYDALADADCVHALVSAMAGMRHIEGLSGELRFRGIDLLVTPSPLPVRPLGREQSNTSVIRGDNELLKCVRRVSPGLSPELEMTQALSAAGFVHTPPPLGVVEYVVPDQDASMLVLVQPYLHNATEGWALALTSLRDLYGDAEERGTPTDDPDALYRTVAEQGSTFAPESRRLGEMTAEMHLALAADTPVETIRPLPLSAETLDAWAAAMSAELDHLLAADTAVLDPLRARRPDLVAAFAALRDLRDGGLQIRHHGDYHLGQVLRTDAGWVVLDFEGEPARNLAERRMRSSPLRDVAGMLRSYDYAAAAALGERCTPATPEFEAMLPHGIAWAQVNRDAFWEAYLARVAGSPLLPAGAGVLVMRRAFELQKAVYEVRYELGHRPEWVGIPMRFLLETPS